jgi:hypothetical protein
MTKHIAITVAIALSVGACKRESSAATTTETGRSTTTTVTLTPQTVGTDVDGPAPPLLRAQAPVLLGKMCDLNECAMLERANEASAPIVFGSAEGTLRGPLAKHSPVKEGEADKQDNDVDIVFMSAIDGSFFTKLDGDVFAAADRIPSKAGGFVAAVGRRVGDVQGPQGRGVDVFVLDARGNITRHFPALRGPASAKAIAALEDGGVIVLAMSGEKDVRCGEGKGSVGLTFPLRSAGFMCSFDAKGVLRMAKPLAAETFDIYWSVAARDVVLHDSNTLTVVGDARDAGKSFEDRPKPPAPPRPHGGYRDVFVASYDKSGARTSFLSWVGDSNDGAMTLLVEESGRVWLAGDVSNRVSFGAIVSGQPLPESKGTEFYLSTTNGFLARYDNLSALTPTAPTQEVPTPAMLRRFEAPHTSVVDVVSVATPAGGVVALLTFDGDALRLGDEKGAYVLRGHGSTDAAIVALDASGQVVSAVAIGGAEDDHPVQLVRDGDAIVASVRVGGSFSVGGEAPVVAADDDLALIRVAP